ncbi:MAG: hypothetical protein JXQ90_02685 [Cyclobacteriaceae bacterium]
MSLRNTVYIICLLGVLNALGQSRALTRPFKYLHPTEKTNTSLDTRKSPYLWKVYVDREGVKVFNDKNLRNESDFEPEFMQEFIVANETEDALLLFQDPNIDSIAFSKDAEKIGWVPKNNLVLWDRFLWSPYLAKMLALASWESVSAQTSTIQPNAFRDSPTNESRYFIFNVVKFDDGGDDVLISLRTFLHYQPKLFCWVKREDLLIVNNRNGFVANRYLIEQRNEIPKIYEDSESLLRKDDSKIVYAIDKIRADEGFLPTGILTNEINEVIWMEDDQWKTGFLKLDYGGVGDDVFKKGILINRQEFSIIKKAIDVLSESLDKADLIERWKLLYQEQNLSIYEELGQYALFEELVQLRFNYNEESEGTALLDLELIKQDDFDYMMRELRNSRRSLNYIQNNIANPFNFAPFLYPHYWIPIDALPLEMFANQFADFVGGKPFKTVDRWEYNNRPANYNYFDVFYVENSHNYGADFGLKDQVIRTFYRTAARIRTNDPNRSALIFFSNTQKPLTGAGDLFTENIAGIMREGVSSRPNRLYDKKALRSTLYAKNIQKIDRLRFHFFVGERFYSEAMNSVKWLLKDFVYEAHEELNASTTEVILYAPFLIEDIPIFMSKIDPGMSESISYRLSPINSRR